MVGGIVIETADVPGKSFLWVNCMERTHIGKRSNPDTCSVLVEKNIDSDQIQIGDKVWWQSGTVYWTPQDCSRVEVKIPKIGGSGVTYETVCNLNG